MSQNFHQKQDISIIIEAGAEVPHYASLGASGADVKAFLKEEIVLAPGKSVLVPTGLRFAIPAGFEIQVRPRSGLALKNQITVLNTPGTIDADYRGELGVILINHSQEPFVITTGMRIAQIVLVPVIQANFLTVNVLETTKRGAGGFGHTGMN
jgi:dUTP pyrophosphatase